MFETAGGIVFWAISNALYYAGFGLLLAKNRGQRAARIAGIGGMLIGPCLLLLPAAQLLLVVPLYTVFWLHGLTLPDAIPPKTCWTALGVTLLAVGGAILCGLALESAS
ncbi:MAG TPA: hypothetical protein VMF30_16175 [Pirellulales bacterium]|nr:hypothetical protein [Pirellulales bacterium]